MRSLICAFVVHILQKQVFSYDVAHFIFVNVMLINYPPAYQELAVRSVQIKFNATVFPFSILKMGAGPSELEKLVLKNL